MYDALLVRHCAPTLAGLKTGSLFSCTFEQKEEMCICLRRWNRLLTKQDIHVLPVFHHGERTLIYIYHPRALLHDLANRQAAQLLTELGYPLSRLEHCLAHLMHRLNCSPDFPHEIGLFLGYPLEDVRGFIRDPAACKLSGCWKVYGDVRTAQARFDMYQSCTQTCCALLSLGVGLQQLASPARNIFDDVI